MENEGIYKQAQESGKSLSEHEHDLRQQFEAGKIPKKRTPTRMETVTVRPEVAAFALAMEAKLSRNDFKGHWEGTPIPVLFKRLYEEEQELYEEIYPNGHDISYGEVMAEAVDVANMAMMVWDNAKKLVK